MATYSFHRLMMGKVDISNFLSLFQRKVVKRVASCKISLFIKIIFEPCLRKPMFWLPTWSDTNQAVQLQKMAKGLKFWIKKVEGLYYLCSENKSADQLCGYREPDLHLCFRI